MTTQPRSMRSIGIAISLVAGQLVSHQSFAQGLNNFFLMGYDNDEGSPWGGTNIDYILGIPDIYYQYRDIGYSRANANITVSNGVLLFSTNGAWVADAIGDTMQNGTGLSPSNYSTTYNEGLHTPQDALIIPIPGSPSRHYLFHGTIDNFSESFAQYLYVSAIDLNMNGGFGSVVSKNIVLIDDTLNIGKITSVRHANGRDWWVFCHKQFANIYLRLLVTPYGIQGPFQQSVGMLRHADGGQVCFSPNGDKFAYYYGAEDDLEIFDFDRCTGLLSNPVHIAIEDYKQMGGVAFSPSGQFLYVSSVLDVYQYDVTVADIAGSMVHLGTWDGFYSPSPPLATVFDIAQLAPDGKIYISTGNGTFHLHVINAPDLPGLACDFQQHAIELPTYNFNSLPNHPNYHLGPIDGSVCDSLGINTLTPSVLGSARTATVFPSPSTGQFTISYPANSEVGSLEILDAAGRVILQERIPQWSTIHSFDLSDQEHGAYTATLRWGGTKLSTHLTVLR
ncbi:MAG: T9SS type A sorting domain-containing protein [Flavobacteriales bacterium]|nr:T9SS type A sorting domain-containing protein [Flavobacteriales bacterium]